jgi:hypothetical protein
MFKSYRGAVHTRCHGVRDQGQRVGLILVTFARGFGAVSGKLRFGGDSRAGFKVPLTFVRRGASAGGNRPLG